jgi:hypothetical protein
MDAKRFADEMVDLTIAEFEREPSSRRRAFLARVTTFHLIDYIPGKPRQKYQRGARRLRAAVRSGNYASLKLDLVPRGTLSRNV